MTISASTPDFKERLKAHLDQADNNYFARHPNAQWRERRYVPGEADLEPTATVAIVTRSGDGRLRRIFRQESAA